MKFILYAKHWQIFSLFFLLPVLIITGGFFYGLDALFYVIPCGIVILVVTLYAWLWSVGKKLLLNIDKEELKSGLFKTLIILPLIILTIVIIFLMLFSARNLFPLFSDFTSLIQFVDFVKCFFPFFSLFIILTVPSFFSISILYCSYFVANLLKQNEVKEKVKFDDFFKEFIMILFFPIGIWFLQPRINRLNL